MVPEYQQQGKLIKFFVNFLSRTANWCPTGGDWSLMKCSGWRNGKVISITESNANVLLTENWGLQRYKLPIFVHFFDVFRMNSRAVWAAHTSLVHIGIHFFFLNIISKMFPFHNCFMISNLHLCASLVNCVVFHFLYNRMHNFIKWEFIKWEWWEQ